MGNDPNILAIPQRARLESKQDLPYARSASYPGEIAVCSMKTPLRALANAHPRSLGAAHGTQLCRRDFSPHHGYLKQGRVSRAHLHLHKGPRDIEMKFSRAPNFG